jgi:hypothetical protein
VPDEAERERTRLLYRTLSELPFTDRNNICTDMSEGRVAACNCQRSNCSSSFCSLGCLDDLATVANTEQLGQLGLQLMVIGVGADITTAPRI